MSDRQDNRGTDEPEQVSRWKDELAEVALSAARMLTNPRYDEAALAELDARAEELRRQIRNAGARRRRDDISLLRMVSGG